MHDIREDLELVVTFLRSLRPWILIHILMSVLLIKT